MKGKKGKPKRKVTFYLREETYRHLKVAAASQLKSMSALLTELIGFLREK